MALREYRRKRHFQRTPEPAGKLAPRRGNSFVVQKHDASHLHYDFRLELDSVRKSWAVPKGPSLDPKVKRLAMQVVDHPYDYREFEGTIPEGNYGAGTVMIWDQGTYAPADASSHDKKVMEADLRHQLRKGKIKFVLEGEKLKGLFALVKSSYRGNRSWLLMKLADEHATNSEVLDSDRSASTGRSLEEIHQNKPTDRTK